MGAGRNLLITDEAIAGPIDVQPTEKLEVAIEDLEFSAFSGHLTEGDDAPRRIRQD